MYETHKSCLICKSDNLIRLNGYEDPMLVKCKTCAFVFLERIPTSAELEERYGYGYGMTGNFISDLTIQRYNELLDYFEQFRDTNRILDIGCGMGFFLETAKKRGWDVYGTEHADLAIACCKEKDINIHPGELDIDNYEKEGFDIVTSFEVIEHINNPIEEVTQIGQMLRTGGIFYFTTPNFNALNRLLLKRNWDVIRFPDHLSYYTKRTMNNLMALAGFKKDMLETTGYSITRFRTSVMVTDQDYITPTSDDEVIRNIVEKNLLLRLLKRSINNLLSILGVGDTLKGVFIKSLR